MAPIGWHTQVAAVHAQRKHHVAVGYDPHRMLCSCAGVQGALDNTSNDIAAEYGQADGFKYTAPRDKFFRRPAAISYGSPRYNRFTREMR